MLLTDVDKGSLDVLKGFFKNNPFFWGSVDDFISKLAMGEYDPECGHLSFAKSTLQRRRRGRDPWKVRPYTTFSCLDIYQPAKNRENMRKSIGDKGRISYRPSRQVQLRVFPTLNMLNSKSF